MSIVLSLQNSITGILATHINDLGNTAAESAQAKAVKDVASSLSATKKALVADVEKRIRMQLKKNAKVAKRKNKEDDRRAMAKELLDPEHEFYCAFINARGDICGADAMKSVKGLEIEGFPHTPQFCTRHYNILSKSDNVNIFETLEKKLNWIGAFAQHAQQDAELAKHMEKSQEQAKDPIITVEKSDSDSSVHTPDLEGLNIGTLSDEQIDRMKTD